MNQACTLHKKTQVENGKATLTKCILSTSNRTQIEQELLYLLYNQKLS